MPSCWPIIDVVMPSCWPIIDPVRPICSPIIDAVMPVAWPIDAVDEPRLAAAPGACGDESLLFECASSGLYTACIHGAWASGMRFIAV